LNFYFLVSHQHQFMHYFQFYNRDKMGIKDEFERCIIPAKYDHIELNSDGLFNVQKEGRTAYFDLAGKIALPFSNEFDSYGNFTEGLARVRTKEGKWGFINKTGTLAIQPSFHFAEEFSDGMAVVRNDKDLHGAIDKKGQPVIPYQFNVLTNFENGYACFGDASIWGLVDKQGTIILPQEYVFIDKVKDGKVRVQVQEGEDFKEGIYTIGGTIEWNNNLDQLNAYNRLYRQFSAELKTLLETYYQQGCPCEYQRFRDFITWDRASRFVDQELLWQLFNPTLEKKADDIYQCKKCSTVYMQHWEQYSAFLWVLNTGIQNPGNFIEKGAAVPSQIPVVLGFQGYNLDGLNEKYIQTDIATTVAYLRGKQ
jgi:hypothetical protein